MKDDEKLYNLKQTGIKLGGVSRNIVSNEIRKGKLKACWRGNRIFCTKAQIEEYKKNQIIDIVKVEVDFADYSEINKVTV